MRPDIQYACQVDKSDVFCQTWSLYLQYEYMRQLCELNLDRSKVNIVIPYNIADKYNLLNNFIQDIIKIKVVKNTIMKQFKDDINYHNLPEIYNNINSYQYLILQKMITCVDEIKNRKRK